MLIQLLILLFSIKFMSPKYFLCLLIVTHETSSVLISAVGIEESTISKARNQKLKMQAYMLAETCVSILLTVRYVEWE